MNAQETPTVANGNEPTRATPHSAGLDLRTPSTIRVPAGKRIMVDLATKFNLPSGCSGRVASKSGLSAKYGIEVGAGVVYEKDCKDDSIKVVLYNFSKEDRTFEEGAQIAQLIYEKTSVPAVCMTTSEKRGPSKDFLYYYKLSDDAFDLIVSNLEPGIDLRTPRDVTIPARGRKLVDLDVAIKMLEGHYGRVASTLNNSVFNGIEVGAGVIDQDYRGNLRILLYNHTDLDCSIARGKVIAQLVCHKISNPQVEERKFDTEGTLRGTKGFGSSYM